MKRYRVIFLDKSDLILDANYYTSSERYVNFIKNEERGPDKLLYSVNHQFILYIEILN
jgi:hypothetical protein